MRDGAGEEAGSKSAGLSLCVDTLGRDAQAARDEACVAQAREDAENGARGERREGERQAVRGRRKVVRGERQEARDGGRRRETEARGERRK